MTSAESEGAAAAAPETVAEPAVETAAKRDFIPTILVFSCNWCSYTSADLAGVNRFRYPSN
ncbi:MAG: hydrogenase iron-sulfur subunit, partial [Thermoplasmata archaeon]|nr:hydrogenase iron-sulfur subunit [Thermoplasmata archaeon]